MESIEIIKIKLYGIIGCIEEYTSEPAISNILAALKTALNENNYGIVLFSCKEIAVWYRKNIGNILSNQYVFNGDVHRDNIVAIESIIEQLECHEDEYKQELNFLVGSSTPITQDNEWISNLLNKFHQIVIQLRDRYNNRDTLDVEDEYDVQDLLHALLQIYCDDIRPEEWAPSYAGTASRQDFY